ncbi:MAG: hypothetical protein OHK0022_46470 [Roseiflexaceae bacterium]
MRQQVFRSDEYTTEAKFQQELLRQVRNLPLGVRIRAQFEVLRGQFQPPASPIDELIARSGTEGTHSILDIQSVSRTPSFGTVSPPEDQQLLSIFGTTKPALAMVTEKINECCKLRERWQGLYIIAYEGDEPTHICFAGFSGD